MIIKYFSWMREGVGTSEESFPLPAGVNTVSDLLDHLCEQSDGHARTLKERVFVRVAVNQTHVDHDHQLTDADEVAVFPPVTGG